MARKKKKKGGPLKVTVQDCASTAAWYPSMCHSKWYLWGPVGYGPCMALPLTLSHPTSFHLPRIPDLFVGQGLLLLAILAPEADPKQHAMACGSIHPFLDNPRGYGDAPWSWQVVPPTYPPCNTHKSALRPWSSSQCPWWPSSCPVRQCGTPAIWPIPVGTS